MWLLGAVRAEVPREQQRRDFLTPSYEGVRIPWETASRKGRVSIDFVRASIYNRTLLTICLSTSCQLSEDCMGEGAWEKRTSRYQQGEMHCRQCLDCDYSSWQWRSRATKLILPPECFEVLFYPSSCHQPSSALAHMPKASLLLILKTGGMIMTEILAFVNEIFDLDQ